MRAFLSKTIVLQCVIALMTFVVYSFALQGQFKTMDDEYCIVNNMNLRSFSHLREVFSSSFFGSNSYYRPLVTFSFMVEYYVYALNAYYYYLDNIILHILTALSVFGTIMFMTRRKFFAFAVAMLFAVHPVQWEAVSNVPGRAILLSAFFSINAFHFFCMGEFRKSAYIVSAVCLVLGLLSKESAGVTPLLMLAYRWFLRMPVQGRRSVLKPVLPFFLIDALYLLLRKHLGITHLFYWPSQQEAALGFISFLRGVLTYFRIFIHPVDLQFDRAQRLFVAFTDPEVRLTLGVYGLILLVLFVFRRRIRAEGAFFISWFVIELMPVSQVLVSIGVQAGYISLAEHFVYSASIGFFAVTALAVEGFYGWGARKRFVSDRVFRIMLIGLLGYFMLMTVQQNIYSGNEIAMFRRTLELNPRNQRVRYNLAYVYARNGQPTDAEREFRQILELTPDVVNARIALGKALCDQGRLWEGLRQYESITDPGGLRHVWEKNVQATYTALRYQYEKRLTEDFNDAQAHAALGIICSKTADLDTAVAHFERAVMLEPENPDFLFNWASSLVAQGKPLEAKEALGRLLPLLKTGDVIYSHAHALYKNILEK